MVEAKIRYAHHPAIAHLYQKKEKIEVLFEEKQRAATKGQAVVFYEEDEVVGGGIIEAF